MSLPRVGSDPRFKNLGPLLDLAYRPAIAAVPCHVAVQTVLIKIGETLLPLSAPNDFFRLCQRLSPDGRITQHDRGYSCARMLAASPKTVNKPIGFEKY
jgi:hypothetical protein